MRRLPPIVAVLLAAAIAALAPRTAGAQAAPEASAARDVPAAPAVPIDDGRRADAHADRVVLLPTAYTHPAGSTYVSSYEVVLLQIGRGITDRTQVSVTMVPPLGAERIFPIDVTLKTVVARGPLVRAALLGSVTSVFGAADDALFLAIGRAGGVVQLCLAERCDSSFVIGSNLSLLGPVLVTWSAAGAIFRISRRVSLLAELDTLVPLGAALPQLNGASLSAGVRWAFQRWSVDLALAAGGNSSGNAGALPILVVSYRPGG